MEATLQQLRERGLETPGAAKRGLDGNWRYWLADPDGNCIELMQIIPNSPQAATDAQ